MPAITGTPRVGEVLTADTSGIADEDGLGTLAYQWVRFDGPTQTNIGTDSSTYTTTNDDAGKKIKVRVSFTDVEGNAEGPLSSKLTELINDSATGVPTISGKPRVGQRLTASTSDIADPGGTDDAVFTYQWVSVDGMTESNIGANSSTYTLADADADKQIKVKVTFTDDEGEAEGPLESLLTESVVADDVQVQNTAQRLANTIRSLEALVLAEAQQFTTGPHVAGYTLTSIVIDFHTIADTSNAGSELTVTLNEESSSNPGDVLCTLSDPATFSSSGLHTFTAPTTGTLCPELAPSTNYLVVITRANTNAGDIFIDVTTSTDIDSGSVTSWSIPSAARAYDGSAWSLDAGVRMMVQVKGALNTEVTVHPDWSLTPTDLSAGEKFRLLFITGTGNPTSSNIATYNTYVQAQAAAGHADIQDYGSWFRILGSTQSTDARDNTSTTSGDTNASTHWLNGAKVADNYGDLYDSSWDDEVNPRGADGAAITLTSPNNHVWTGSETDGTEASTGGFSQALGTGPVRSGRLNGVGSPLNSTSFWTTSTNWRYYALSGLFVVSDANAKPVFSAETADRTLPENSGAGVDVAGGAVTATDRNSGDTLTYSLTGTDAGSFEIDSSSGQISTKTGVTHNFNFEAATNSYSVTVEVSDSKDADGVADTVVDDTIAVTIDLTNVDETGTVTLPATLIGGTAATASVADPDGSVSVVSWRWARGNTATGSFSNISGATSASYTPVAEDVGKYLRATVTYKDAESTTVNKTASATSSSTVAAGNAEPTFDDGATATRTLPENSGAGVDVAGGTITAADGDSDTLTYSLASSGDHASFEIDSSTGQLKTKAGVTHNFNFESSKKSYSVTVNVRDSKDAAGAADAAVDDTIAVTINLTDVNEAPVILSPETTLDARENQTLVIVLVAGDLDASDTKTWSVESADDGGTFEINAETASTAILTFKNAPDFETPTDVGAGAMNNTYVVTVKVADAGGLSDTHTITVTVTNVNEAPEITTTSTTHTDFNVDENTATSDVIKTYEATDVDASSTLTWSLEGNDAGDFTITKNADGHGDLKFRNAPNFEMPVDADTMNDYDIRVKVRDDGIPGNRGSSNQLDDTVSVEVNVQDVNEAPEIAGAATPDFAEIEYDATSPDLTVGTYTYTDEDRNPADTITWGLSGADATHFDIGSSSGVLSFDMRPDFENPFGADNEYVIFVEADDGQGGVGTFAVIVTVTNVDETPEITTTAASHTAPSFVEIEYDAATADLTVADYDGRDEEGQTISWSRTGADAGYFTIDGTTGVLSFAQRPNFEMPADGGGDNVYNITVKARDTASLANTRELEVVLTVTDVNERPDIDEDTVPSYAEIQYDFTGTRPDVHTFTATDYDDMDTFAWSLLGTDDAYLEIDATTGILTFAQDDSFGQGPLPNFEHPRDDDAGDGSSNTYSITVRATDDDATDQKFTDYAVIVTVTDVNEQPEFTGTPETALTPDEHDANTDYVVMDLADYDARDEEGGVTWSLTGTDRGDFAVSADGVVTFDETPNYEEPEDSGGDNVYEFTVVATDVASGSSRRNVSQAVTVTVGDVEEAGTVTVDNLSPAVSQTLTFRLTDPDGGIDLTVDTNLGSPINWRLESQASGGSWTQVFGLSIPVSTTFPYTVDEDLTGKALRAVVTYVDRRGSGKLAVSEETASVTPDPIANAPPRFRGGSHLECRGGRRRQGHRSPHYRD